MPNFVLNSDYKINDEAALPKGSYVVPIKVQYIPKHVLNAYPFFNKDMSTFCYTKYGIIPILRSYIDEV